MFVGVTAYLTNHRVVVVPQPDGTDAHGRPPTSHRVFYFWHHNLSQAKLDHPWFKSPRVQFHCKADLHPLPSETKSSSSSSSSSPGKNGGISSTDALTTAIPTRPKVPNPFYFMLGFQIKADCEQFEASLLPLVRKCNEPTYRIPIAYLGSGAGEYAATPGSASASSSTSSTVGGAVAGGNVPVQMAPVAPPRPAMTGVGIAGIMRRVEMQHKQTDRELEVAFTDLSSLVAHAEKVVNIASRIAAKNQQQQQQQGTSASSTESAEAKSEQAMFADLMLTMGIANPVTKESAGTAYHVELARQLVDFLQRPLALYHGIMTLTDIYSLYCRARGTELISPEDLLFAARRWESLGLPMKLKTFPNSGVMVVMTTSFDEKALRARILDLIKSAGASIGATTGSTNNDNTTVAAADGGDGGTGSGDMPLRGLTAHEIATQLHVSLVFIEEIMKSLEFETHAICRDHSLEGTRFFINMFVHCSTSSSTTCNTTSVS